MTKLTPMPSVISTLCKAYELAIEAARQAAPIDATAALLLANMGDKEYLSSRLRIFSVGTTKDYALNKLIRIGYLKKRPNIHSKRTYYVSATALGIEVGEAVRKALTEHASITNYPESLTRHIEHAVPAGANSPEPDKSPELCV